MIFSSIEFLLVFLPIAVLGYYFCIKHVNFTFAIAWIFLISAVYYAYWNVTYIFLLLFSIIFNYIFGNLIAKNKHRKTLFILGILINLSALAFFKYTNFTIETVNTIFNLDTTYLNIILPIGISFFTFQQIAYLSDIYTEKHIPSEKSFLQYCCFVCFFPQLVAGPIVHHNEMMPQFNTAENHQIRLNNIYAGLVILGIGLGKKVIVADNLAPIVKYCFDQADSLTFFEATFAALAYTLQLYFDFSGYSDMAIGCALLFNIHLPENFLYPYRAKSIQDFWRRWHITLSRWLREYLYIPLGGNRLSNKRTYINIFTTFLIGGLWHGAAWTFVLWGAFHGIALVVQRFWSQFIRIRLPAILCWGMTFSFISLAWVVFRVISFERLQVFIEAFLGYNGFDFSIPFQEQIISISPLSGFSEIIFSIFAIFILSLLKISFFEKNALVKQPYKRATILSSLLILISLIWIASETQQPEFIYFQF